MEAAGGEEKGSGPREPDQGERRAARRRRQRDDDVGEQGGYVLAGTRAPATGASRWRRFAIRYCCGMLKMFCAV